MPGGSHLPAEATASGRPVRQGKSAPGSNGPAATDPNPQRQQKLDLPPSRPANSTSSHLRRRAKHGAANEQPAVADPTEVCSPDGQPFAAGPTAPEPNSGEPAAVPQLSLSPASAEPLEAHADAPVPAAADAACRQDGNATAAGDAAPEQASLVAAAMPAFSEGAIAKQPWREQQWKCPGKETGLPYFGYTRLAHNYQPDGTPMESLRAKIARERRGDLLGLLKGWTACRVESGGNTFFKVPDEGVIRSVVNAFKYLVDLARLNPGKLTLTGEEEGFNPSHAYRDLRQHKFAAVSLDLTFTLHCVRHEAMLAPCAHLPN